ncbi:MAG: hypothetical protein D6739_04485, partial [Nitrospirae bacterium]
PAEAPAKGEAAAPAAKPAEGDELLERLQRILEEPSETEAPEAEKPAAPSRVPPPEELHLKEVEQPLFEKPKKRGWFGRLLDRLRGRGAEAEEAAPETAPDVVSPIYRYTPEKAPAPEGEEEAAPAAPAGK